ncbi:MAG: diguanylate cyclase [Acidobacteriota bacterium]
MPYYSAPPDADRITQERLQLALESAQMGTWDFDFLHHHRVIDDRTATMLGFGAEPIPQTAVDAWLNLVHPQDRHKIVEATQIYRKGLSDIISIEYRIRHRQGHYVWVQSHGKLVERDHRGRPKRVVGTLRDITAQRQREAVQQQQRQLLDMINQAQATFLLNHDIKDACEALFAPLLSLSDCEFGMIGVVPQSPPGTSGPRPLFVPTMSLEGGPGGQHRSREYGDLRNILGQVLASNEAFVLTDGGQEGIDWPPGIPPLHNFLGLPIRFDNEVVGLIGLGNRASDFDPALLNLLAPLVTTLGTLIHARRQEEARMQAEQEWLRLATEDTLTGLPNRRHFFDVAETCLLQTRRYGNPMTVALLDLDNFKQINDTYGHSAGDEVLRVLADILRQALRDSDTPARIGGEEFAVILTSTSLEDSVTALERIRATLSLTPITMGPRTLHATVSIGAVQWDPDAHEHVHSMLQQADAALYRAKRRGRNRVEVHQPLDAEPFNETPQDTGWGLLGLA